MVAKFANVVPIVVPGPPNLVPELPNVFSIVVSGSPNVVAMWFPLWCLDLSMRWLIFQCGLHCGVQIFNLVPEFPNVVPVVVSECLDLRMWCLNFPMWCPLWCLDLSM